MSVLRVQTFGYEDRAYDGLSHGVLVVEESKLVAEEEDSIRVLWSDEDEEGDDYVVDLILPLRDEPGRPPRVAVHFSEPHPVGAPRAAAPWLDGALR